MCREGETFFFFSPALSPFCRSSVLPVISGICCPTLRFYALLPSQVICLNSSKPLRVGEHERRRREGGREGGG